jgi:hypothetical protein
MNAYLCIGMSPTVFRYKNYRFFFFSREETRIHIHVLGVNGEAKFWMEPQVELAYNYGFNQSEISELTEIIIKHKNEINKAWNRHFRN